MCIRDRFKGAPLFWVQERKTPFLKRTELNQINTAPNAGEMENIMALAVKTNQLTKTYNNTPCVNNVDLQSPEGSIYGFLGPNGAGKSTTMKMILGLIKCSGGRCV